MPQEPIIKAAVIIARDGKALETLSKKNIAKNTWYFPGGKPEDQDNGDYKRTAIREFFEELSVELLESDLEYFGTFEALADGHLDKQVVMVCYRVKHTKELEERLVAQNEVHKFDWFDYSQRDRVSAVDQLIFDDLRSRDLIEGNIEGKEHFIEAAIKRRQEMSREAGKISGRENRS